MPESPASLVDSRLGAGEFVTFQSQYTRSRVSASHWLSRHDVVLRTREAAHLCQVLPTVGG